MNLLAIETSTDACSVALRVGGETLVDHRVAPRRHAQIVLPMIDALLARAGLPRAALDGVAFGRGPGSFTGVRVAASVAQGIALGLDIGVVGVSTLACIAEGCRRELGDTRVGVALDARLDEIYWGAFVVSADRVMTATIEERVCAPDRATLREGERSDRWRLAGAGAERYERTLVAALFSGGEKRSGEAARDDEGSPVTRAGRAARDGDGGPVVRTDRLPNSLDTLTLASVTVASEGFGPPESALPVYLRERVARTEAERGVVRRDRLA